MPPKVEAEGFGSRAAPSVPLLMLVALVASVLHDAAAFERSPHAGCAWAGTPRVEIAVRKLWLTAASDSIPPRVEAVGVGNRAAPRVPLEIFDALVVSVEQLAAPLLKSPQAGWAWAGTPDVLMAVRKSCVTAAIDWTPPKVEALGLGRSAPT